MMQDRIEVWKKCWGARLDAGFGGPIKREEEGNRYHMAEVIGGELVLSQNSAAAENSVESPAGDT
jgi:hypothetical protein